MKSLQRKNKSTQTEVTTVTELFFVTSWCSRSDNKIANKIEETNTLMAKIQFTTASLVLKIHFLGAFPPRIISILSTVIPILYLPHYGVCVVHIVRGIFSDNMTLEDWVL